MTVKNFQLMTGTMLPRKKIYKDTLNNLIYYCDAPHWSLLTDNVWKVVKWLLDSDWDIEEVRETDWYNNYATDLSTVQSLSFS